MDRQRILFVCIHNSARSQMAEAYLRHLSGEHFEVESAGIEPGKLNPLVVEAMKEEGIDLTGKSTKSVFDLLKQGTQYDAVITVCDEAAAEQCPVFPGKGQRLHWRFPDPSTFTGSYSERMARTREVRDQIRQEVERFVEQSGVAG